LNLFVFSMTMLVLAGDFLLLYVFWEAVGLCSYLLIGFWYTRPAAAQAGKKAFIVNRVGDVGFGLGVMWLWTALGTLEYGAVFKGAETLAPATATGIALLLFVGACGKSAQLPLHTWLPDAMEGPTPVSALIHAATMVTAGVYMVARSHALFERSGTALEVVAWVGTATALFAATIALIQTDIKRVLAYSTISQLGYMFAAVGLGAYAAGIFHLVTHAFFKALLFLGAGSVIHGMGGEQDLRKMGGLAPKMVTTTITMTIGAVGRGHALRALPHPGLPAGRPRVERRGDAHARRAEHDRGQRGHRARLVPVRRGAGQGRDDRATADAVPQAAAERVLRRPHLRPADRAAALRPVRVPGVPGRPRHHRWPRERGGPRRRGVGRRLPSAPDRVRRELRADDAGGRRPARGLPADSMKS